MTLRSIVQRQQRDATPMATALLLERHLLQPATTDLWIAKTQPTTRHAILSTAASHAVESQSCYYVIRALEALVTHYTILDTVLSRLNWTNLCLSWQLYEFVLCISFAFFRLLVSTDFIKTSSCHVLVELT